MTELAGFLDRLYERFHRSEFLTTDPLEFPHRYRDPLSQEAVALVSALLAYGNVTQIRRSLEELLGRVGRGGRSPEAFVRSFIDPKERKWAEQALKGFVHRFNRGEDLALLFLLLGRSWQEHGSLGAHFLSNLSPSDPDIGNALNGLIRDWRAWAGSGAAPGFRYLLTAPEDGSCCKRWCLFLRWMGRADKEPHRLDLGLWTRGGRRLQARQLILPLDTHTARISRLIGLTHRRSTDWKTALEVTAALRRCDPADPARYDFALSRLGILDLCKNTYRVGVCEKCELLRACRHGRKAGHVQS